MSRYDIDYYRYYPNQTAGTGLKLYKRTLSKVRFYNSVFVPGNVLDAFISSNIQGYMLNIIPFIGDYGMYYDGIYDNDGTWEALMGKTPDITFEINAMIACHMRIGTDLYRRYPGAIDDFERPCGRIKKVLQSNKPSFAYLHGEFKDGDSFTFEYEIDRVLVRTSARPRPEDTLPYSQINYDKHTVNITLKWFNPIKKSFTDVTDPIPCSFIVWFKQR